MPQIVEADILARFKRSAEAFSLNGVVDVQHEMICLIISGIARTINFKIYRNAALNKFYISSGNDVTIYFWSAANLTNVFILGHFRVAISR